jgi:hypothetical protein
VNFFMWIRDGVRRAVLMGVSDAVTDLGTPTEDDDISHRLLEVIRSKPALPHSESVATGGSRRKLGRGLQEIQPSTAKAS